MRLFALLLIFANLALWGYRDFAAPRLRGSALAQQVHPERLRLIGAAELMRSEKQAPPCVAFGPLDDAKLALAKMAARDLQNDISMAERRGDKGSYLELRSPSEALRGELATMLGEAREEVCPG